MKAMMRWILLATTVLLQGQALAQSLAQQQYAACLAQAEHEQRLCRREEPYGRGCRADYRYEKERCWNSYVHDANGPPGYYVPYGQPYYAVPGRFQPVPIPQRPVYILPGMR